MPYFQVPSTDFFRKRQARKIKNNSIIKLLLNKLLLDKDRVWSGKIKFNPSNNPYNNSRTIG